MEENNNENQQSELKKQATDAFNHTKEQIKNIDFKAEAEKGKGLVGKLFKKPIETIKDIVNDTDNQFYKTAILIILLWVIIVFCKEILNCMVYEYHKFNLLNVLKLIIAPVLEIGVMSLIIHVFNKDSNKNVIKSITAVSIASIPSVVASLLGFFSFISSKAYYITSPIASLLYVISTVLMFFVVKEMFKKEDNEEALKEFIKVEAVYYVVAFLIYFLGISI